MERRVNSWSWVTKKVGVDEDLKLDEDCSRTKEELAETLRVRKRLKAA